VTFRLAAAALLATLVAASPARAQTLGDANVFVRLGAYSPQQADLDGYGAGFDVEAGLGYRLLRHLAVEGALGAYRSQRDMPDPVTGATIHGAESLYVVPMTGTLRAILPLRGLELSALGGIGVYAVRWDTTIPVAVSLSPDSGTIRQPVSLNDRTWGLHAGGGASVDLTPRITLGADFRYVFASAKLLPDTTTHIGGLRVGGVVACRF
jgi:opacity protein-like surface antigen